MKTYKLERIGYEGAPLEFKTQKEAAKFLGISVKEFKRIYKGNSEELVFKKTNPKKLTVSQQLKEAKKDLKELTKKYNALLKEYNKIKN